MGLKILLGMANLRTTGALTVGLGLMEGFRQLESDDKYFVMHPTGVGYEELMHKSNICSIPIECRKGLLYYKLYVDQILIPSIVRKYKIDVLLSCNSISSWNPGCLHIALVHFPYLAYKLREIPFSKTTGFKLRCKMADLYFRMMLKNLHVVIVQTPVMQKRIINRWGLKDEQVKIIPPASNESGVAKNSPAPELPQQVKAIHGKLPYICYIAGDIPHKNFEILPQTWEYLLRNGFKVYLVLTTDSDSPMMQKMLNIARKIGVDKYFICIGNINNTQVEVLLRNSLCLIMPTLLETLGLPYLEAMRYDCPIASSDLDFARWVCGAAAAYFNPKNCESVGSAILKMRDESFRNDLIERGREQLANNFQSRTWRDVAQIYMNVFKEQILKVNY